MPTVAIKDAEAPLILTIDVGSSSLRASFFDARGRNLESCQTRISYQFDTTPDGGVEKDPDELLQKTYSAIDQALTAIGTRASDIKAVAIDTFWHSVLGIDKNMQAVTPLLSWADTRSAAFAAQLRRELNEREVHARVGCLLHASYYPAKIRWWADTQPTVYRRVVRWVSFGEYFYLNLFGECRASISIASGTGLLNQFTCQWDEPMLKALSLDSNKLSPLSDLDNPQYGLKPEFVQRWEALKEVPWFPAIGDGAAGNIGSGCYAPNRIALMIGTSAAMRVVWSEKDLKKDLQVPEGLWRYRVDKYRPVMGGATSEGGNLFAWMQQTFKLPDPLEVETELSQQAPDGHGLTMLPFLSGERAPGWAAQARAAITGLSLDTNPIEILRAGLESIAFRFGLIYSLLEPALPHHKNVEIVASGGALARSPSWAQIVADVLNHPVILSSEPESSSRGAALLALEQLGIFGKGGIENAQFEFDITYEPNLARHKIYQEAMKRQQELYKLVVSGQ